MYTLLNVFLQAGTLANTTTITAKEQEKISLLHLLFEGGILMIPLGVCFFLLLFVFINKLITVRKAGIVDNKFTNRLIEDLQKGSFDEIRRNCRIDNSPLSRIINKGIEQITYPNEGELSVDDAFPVNDIEKAMENTGRMECYQLEKNLSVLSIITSVAPIFGFLGTIAGMIILFFNVQHQGFSLENIAGGIYTKMVTSATGLIVGLLAHICHEYLTTQIYKCMNSYETVGILVVDLIKHYKRALKKSSDLPKI